MPCKVFTSLDCANCYVTSGEKKQIPQDNDMLIQKQIAEVLIRVNRSLNELLIIGRA